jgi:mono/diheme cytochrome c family protein
MILLLDGPEITANDNLFQWRRGRGLDGLLVYFGAIPSLLPAQCLRLAMSYFSMKDCLTLFLLAVSISASSAIAAEESAVSFNRDIRSILSANCFTCHGPDDKRREADLRLDEEDGIVAAFGGGLSKSAAWQRIISKDPDEQMPPPDSHLELKPEQIGTLKRWIDAGAKWEGHWSFIPPAKPPLPTVSQPGWVKNPIDSFILRRLEEAGLSVTAEADRERLLRRVTLDLTGLPPTLEEIDAFLSDDSANAYEKVVDRLLKSPHFGERMALVWMDAARYGDSSVFHADGPRDMWPWRDWVINAYNANKPFDQFTVEQLAGDLIPDATVDQKIATGFNRNNATTDEGGAIAEEFRVEYAVDRVKTTSMVWMGLSLECAQCHNHKYDPITMEDYYRVFAYFNQASDPGMQTRKGNQSPIVDVFDAKQLAESAILKERLPPLEGHLKERDAAAEEDFQKWLTVASADADGESLLPGGAALHLTLDESLVDLVDVDRKIEVKGKTLWSDGKFGKAFQLDGGNWIDLGQAADFTHTDGFSYGVWIKPQGNASGTVLAKMDDGSAYRGFDMLFTGGKLAVHLINSWPTNAIKVNTKNAIGKDEWQHVFVTYDGSSKASGVKIYFDGKPQEWTIEQDRLSATIRAEVPLYVGRRSTSAPFKGLVDDVRIYPRALSESEVQALAGSDPIRPLLAVKSSERTAEQTRVLRTHYLTSIDGLYQNALKQVAELKAKIAASEKPVSTVMVMADVPEMRQTFMLERGNYSSPLKDSPVSPGVLASLPPLPEGAPANRLGLAQWLVQRDHPLTARVTVNRYWYMLFGAGLVRTLEDFGAQGEWPSHPALLDWLAVDFVESNWDIKRTLKQMVMSATYRQSSRVTPQLLEADPENRLFARGPRFRLQGEFIRDSALAASGLLTNTVGGPSVKPYQPDGLWLEVALSGARFTRDNGEKLYRRSMYTYWKRSAPAPSLTIFDTPTREKCSLRRSRTNTPLQALVTLNDVQFVEAARSLAERTLKHGGDTLDSQIEHAYRLVTGVRPNSLVRVILKESFEQELPVFQNDLERAKKLISAGESKRDESLDAARHAAMTVIMSMILNLDETLTRG